MASSLRMTTRSDQIQMGASETFTPRESSVPRSATTCGQKWGAQSCEVNRQLIPVKINYFCQFFVIATLFLYVNPILAQSGLTASQLGFTGLITNAFATCARLISGPVMDRTKKKNFVIIALSLVTALMALCLFGLPREREYLFEGHYDENGFFVAKVERQLMLKENDTDSQSEMNQTLKGRVCWPTLATSCILLNRTQAAGESNFTLTLNYTDDNNRARYAVGRMLDNDQQQWIDSKNGTSIKCLNILVKNSTGCLKIQNVQTKNASYLTVLIGLVLRTILTCAHAPILNLLDSITFGILGEAKSQFYGRSRLFGSLGYIVGSLLTGFIIYEFSDAQTGPNTVRLPSMDKNTHQSTGGNYAPSIMMGAGFACAGALATFFSKPAQSVSKLELRKAFVAAIRSPEMLKCMFNCLLTGLAISLVGEYFTLIMTVHYGFSHHFLGALISIIIITEVPVFLVTGSLVRRFGPTMCLAASHFVWTVWFASLTYFSSPWALLVAQAWSGLAFPLAYNAVLHQAAEAGRDQSLGEGGLVASMQAIAVAVLCGFAQCIGGLGWGVLLDYLPGRQLFALAACYTCVVMFTIPVLAYLITKICKRPET